MLFRTQCCNRSSLPTLHAKCCRQKLPQVQARMIIGVTLCAKDSPLLRKHPQTTFVVHLTTIYTSSAFRFPILPRDTTATSLYRVSSDILEHVFRFLSLNEQPRSFRRLPIHQRLGWIKVSQVCRYWRQITLTTPILWTRIVFDLGLRWALETLTRSKTVPIIIKHSAITFASRLNQRLPVPMPVDLVAPHLSHTRVIDLCGSDEDLSPVIQSLILPAPVLKRVKLENNSSYGAIGVISNLPHDLFAQFAPLLRTASFNGFRIPWSSGFLHNLMNLSVTLPSTASDSSALPPPDEFYGGLSHDTSGAFITRLYSSSSISSQSHNHASSAFKPQVEGAVVELHGDACQYSIP